MFETIEKWLRDGALIRGFSSGGGVRVLRIDNMPEKGYSEGATIDEAFEELEKKLGDKNYHADLFYLAGDKPKTKFDNWVRYHEGFEIVFNQEFKMVEIQIKWIHFFSAPTKSIDTVQHLRIPMIVTDVNGRKYEMNPSNSGYGQKCVEYKQLHLEKEKHSFSEHKTMKFAAPTLKNLLDCLECCLPNVNER